MYSIFFSSQRLNAAFQFLQALEDNRARTLVVEGKNGLAPEFLHDPDEIAASSLGQEVAVKSLSGQRPGDRAVRGDEPEVESKLLRDRQGKRVAAAGDEDDLDTLGVSPPQRGKVGVGDLKLGIQQGAVNIDGNKAEGIGGHNRF